MASAPNVPAKDDAAGDFDHFKAFARQILSIPHSEIQKRMKAEKRTKASASPGPVSDKTAR